jgi:hypothetical protein
MWPDTQKMIVQTTKFEQTSIGIEETGQQKGFIDELFRDPELRGTGIKAVFPTRTNSPELSPGSAVLKQEKFFLVKRYWINVFLDECAIFIGHSDKHDDQIEAKCGCYQIRENEVLG